MIRTYSEMCKFATFNERFNYLSLDGVVAAETFGFDRYLNQRFYKSLEWRRLRNQIIVRDNGCDLGIDGHEIFDHVIIHHMNPIGVDDITNATDFLLNPEYMVCVSRATHNAIHYGDEDLLKAYNFAERKPGDTRLW